MSRGIFALWAKTTDPSGAAAFYGLEKGGRVLRFIDQKVIDDCTPYVPASPDRTLEFSAQVSTETGSGMVVWNTPYAHYQYMGIVYGRCRASNLRFEPWHFCLSGKNGGLLRGRRLHIPILEPETGILLGWFSPPGRPKHPTGRELTYDTSQNPMARPFWFERAKADHLAEWLDEIRGIARAQR